MVMTVGSWPNFCVRNGAVRYKCEISRAIRLSQELKKRRRGVMLFKPCTRRLSSAYSVHERGAE